MIFTAVDMRKTLIGIAAATLLGCSGGSDGRPKFFSIGTVPPGGAFFVVSGAIAQAIDENTRATGWQVSSEATKGTQENIRRLAKNELDFALANAAILYFATRGEGKWEGKQETRAVMTLAPNIALFIAPRGSGVSAMADLEGKRVRRRPGGRGFRSLPATDSPDARYHL